VVEAEPGTVEVVIARDHARLVEGEGGHWSTDHDVEPFHSCAPPGAA
jgi:hypothetical protein